MANKMTYFRFQKLIIYFVITVIAIQLIYFYSSLGFVYVILYLLFLLNSDIYKLEYRKVKMEIITTVLFIITSSTLILSHFVGDIAAYLYYLLLIVISLLSIYFTLAFKNVYVKKEHFKVNDRNIKMIQKDNKFIVIYAYLINIILLGIIGQSIYLMITL